MMAAKDQIDALARATRTTGSESLATSQSPFAHHATTTAARAANAPQGSPDDELLSVLSLCFH